MEQLAMVLLQPEHRHATERQRAGGSGPAPPSPQPARLRSQGYGAPDRRRCGSPPPAAPPTLGDARGCAGVRSHRHRLEFAILLTGGLISLCGCLLLAPGYGGLGVAVSTLAGYVLVNGVRTVLCVRVMGGLDMGWGDLAAPASCLALAFLVRILAERFGAHDWATAIGAAAGLITGYAGLYALVLLRLRERSQLLRALSRRRWRSGADAVPSRS